MVFSLSLFYQRVCTLLSVCSTPENSLQELFNASIQSSPLEQSASDDLEREFPDAHSIIPSAPEQFFTFTTCEGCEFYLPHSRLDVIKKNSHFMEGLIGFTQHSGANCKLEMSAEEFESILRVCLATRGRFPKLGEDEINKLYSNQMHGESFDALVFSKMIEATDFYELDFQLLRTKFVEGGLPLKAVILSKAGNLKNVKMLFNEQLKAITFKGQYQLHLEFNQGSFLDLLDFNKFDQELIFQIIIVISFDRVVDCLGIIKALKSSNLSSEEREVASSLIDLMPPHIRLIESFDFSNIDEDRRLLIKKTFMERGPSTKAAILSKIVSLTSLVSIFREELESTYHSDSKLEFAYYGLKNEMVFRIFKLLSKNQKSLLSNLIVSLKESRSYTHNHASIDLMFSLINLMTFEREMLQDLLPFLASYGRFFNLRCLSNLHSVSLICGPDFYDHSFNSLPQLRELSLFDLFEKNSYNFSSLTNLRSLTITSNGARIRFLPHALEELEVTCADIEWLSEVGKCTDLRKLSLKKVRAQGDLKPLSKLTKLQSLDLDLTMQYPDLDPLSSFVGLTKLERFTFKDFTLTDLQQLRLRA